VTYIHTKFHTESSRHVAIYRPTEQRLHIQMLYHHTNLQDITLNITSVVTALEVRIATMFCVICVTELKNTRMGYSSGLWAG